MSDNNSNVLAPPQPPDQPGTRPKLDLVGVAMQIRAIQEKLAAERAAKGDKSNAFQQP